MWKLSYYRVILEVILEVILGLYQDNGQERGNYRIVGAPASVESTYPAAFKIRSLCRGANTTDGKLTLAFLEMILVYTTLKGGP